jgi:glycosyltransferase involved in cell wall biosynthesis
MSHPQQRIRLLLAIPHLGGGGAERVIALLAQNLDPARFETHLVLITADLPGACLLPPHVIVHRLDKRRIRQAALPLMRLIRALHPDVVLSGMAHLSFLILLLKPFLPRRTRILIRQNTTASAASSHWLTRLFYRHLYPRADRILCQSSPMAEDLVLHFGLNRDRLAVLCNPIAPSPATPSQSENYSEDINLLFIGRLSQEKGVDILLRAFQSVQQRHLQARLTLLGSGPEERALRNLAAELNLTQSVHFAGHVDPAPYYAAATLFVLPSRYEGIPNALLEAAAAGLPIVATPASGGLVELLQNQPHCWLASAITPEAIAESILTAIASLQSPVTQVQHSFLAPFYLDRAIPAYAEIIEREARPRIAMLIPTLDQIGGAERQLLDLSKELAHRNWHVTVITLSGSANVANPASAELTQAKIALLSLRMRKAWIDPRGWLLYLRWHHRDHPQILHAHLPHASFFARLSRLIAPVLFQSTPVLIDTIHTSAAGPLSRRLTYRLTNRLSSQVTCVSQAVATSVRQSKTAPNPLVIPNGIAIPSLQAASPNPGTHMGAPHLASEMWESNPLTQAEPAFVTPFRWLAVGRLAPVKDYPTLLRAFALLPNHPTLTIAGTGPAEPELRALATSLYINHHIDQRVHFAGFQADIQPLLAAADAFVLASLWEGLPISILEASAAALPIVATDAAGTRETLIPGQTGFLVPVGDPKALAAAMAALQSLSLVEREAIGQAGRTFVEANYSLGEITNRWEQLYRDLLEHQDLSS